MGIDFYAPLGYLICLDKLINNEINDKIFQLETYYPEDFSQLTFKPTNWQNCIKYFNGLEFIEYDNDDNEVFDKNSEKYTVITYVDSEYIKENEIFIVPCRYELGSRDGRHSVLFDIELYNKIKTIFDNLDIPGELRFISYTI